MRYASSKRTAEKSLHATLFDASISSRKNVNDGLDFVTQIYRWLTNVMIQTQFTDGVDLSVKYQETKVLQKPFQPDQRETSTS